MQFLINSMDALSQRNMIKTTENSTSEKVKLTVALGKESRIVVSTAASILAEHGEGCEVGVLAREQVGVHRDLHATELNCSRIVEPNKSKEKTQRNDTVNKSEKDATQFTKPF